MLLETEQHVPTRMMREAGVQEGGGGGAQLAGNGHIQGRHLQVRVVGEVGVKEMSELHHIEVTVLIDICRQEELLEVV
jgi:hypothetical protein